MRSIERTVWGLAVPQGSKRGFVSKGRVVLVEQAGDRLKAWRNDIREEFLSAFGGQPQLFKGPVRVWIRLFMPRPKSHLTTTGALKPSAVHYHTNRPDIDKLTRAILDALTGVVFDDDSCVSVLHVTKAYAMPGGAPCAIISVSELA